MGYHDKPFCFHYNTPIDADVCDDCCETFLVKRGCQCGKHTGEDHERFDALLDQIRGREIRERETRRKRKE
jgi:hypothetical protein